MSYSKYGGNAPGTGLPAQSGAKGSYARMGASGNPHATGGKKMMNMPGKGAGKQSKRPAGGKKGYTGRSGAMRMGA